MASQRAKNVSNSVAWAAAWLVLVGLLTFLSFTVLILAFPQRQPSMFGEQPDEPSPLLPFLVVMAILLIVIAVMVWYRPARRRRGALILGYIEEATRLHLPLAPMILAAARSERGALRSRLISLHQQLDAGAPLDQALRCAAPEIPLDVGHAINAAERIGRLPHVLRRIIRRAAPIQALPNLDGFYRGYAISFFFCAVIAIFSVIVCFVMPKFVQIFHDFHVPLPRSTQWLMTIGDRGIYLALLAAIVFFVAPSFQPLWDRVLWWLPVTGPIRDRALADLCDFLVGAVEAGTPMDDALRQIADAQPNTVLRRRVKNWSSAISSGQSLSDAARAAAMPALMVSMLKTARGNEDLIQVLSFLSRYYESRFSRAYEVFRSATVPALVFLMGATALFLALSVFQPLIMLTNAACPYPGGF